MKHYSSSFKTVIMNKHKDGASNSSLSMKYGVSRYAVQSWCRLRPEVQIRQIAPKRKGRRHLNESNSQYDLLLDNKPLLI